MRLVLVAMLMLSTSIRETPTREGYAETYSFRDGTQPGIVFIATTRHGISLSEANDPVAEKKWASQVSRPPKLFYIRVYAGHITATDTETNKTESVPLRNVVSIKWRK